MISAVVAISAAAFLAQDSSSICVYDDVCVNITGIYQLGSHRCTAQLSPYLAEGHSVFWSPIQATELMVAAAERRDLAIMFSPTAYPWKYCHFFLNNLLPLLNTLLHTSEAHAGKAIDLMLHHGAFESVEWGRELEGFDSRAGFGPRHLEALKMLNIERIHVAGGKHAITDAGELGWVPSFLPDLRSADMVCYDRVVAGLGGARAHWSPHYQAGPAAPATANANTTAGLPPQVYASLRQLAIKHYGCPTVRFRPHLSPIGSNHFVT
jgi:hypothetical protein